MSFLHLFITLLLNLVFAHAARILAVFPVPSISHQVVFRPLVQELAKRGHEVVVITTDPAFPKGQAPTNLTEIDVHDMSYSTWTEFVAKSTGKSNDQYDQIKTALDLFTIIVEKQIQNAEVQKILKDKSKTFDLLLLEACVRQALGFSYVYKVPVIQVSSLGPVFDNYKSVGGPTHPLLYPNILNQRLYNLTIWEKLWVVYYYYQVEYLYYDHENEENAMLKRNFGPDTPTVTELSENIDMLFLNVHPIWEGNFPVPPSVIYMGGIHQKPSKDIPQDLKLFLDSSKHGVIYMSFGTNTNPSTLPPERIQMFVKTFAQLPYDILWKWDKDSLPGQSKNIRIGKWFPQSDLLKHPNIKLFITQGGLQSTDEAISAGVPLLGIPMLGDQWYNVEKYVYHKIGVKLDLETITEEKFDNAIKTVINNESYRLNIKRLKELMHDEPMSGLQRAVWWTEHVLRHGGARHLRAPAANISWSEYLELELVSIVLIALLIVIVLVYSVLKRCYKIVSRILSNVDENKKNR
nr:UDP-glucuronosyltransferase UGT33AX2 [Tuta absoluta]